MASGERKTEVGASQRAWNCADEPSDQYRGSVSAEQAYGGNDLERVVRLADIAGQGIGNRAQDTGDDRVTDRAVQHQYDHGQRRTTDGTEADYPGELARNRHTQ